MWFSFSMPDENSQLECDASHWNTNPQSCLGQQCAQGHRGACSVSVGALQRHAGCGCGCSDRNQGYSEQMQQSPTWSPSGVWQQWLWQSQSPCAHLFSLQLWLHFFLLLFSCLWKQQTCTSPSSWGLKNSTFCLLWRSLESPPGTGDALQLEVLWMRCKSKCLVIKQQVTSLGGEKKVLSLVTRPNASSS